MSSNEIHKNINDIHRNLKILTVDHSMDDHDTLPESLKAHFKRANLVLQKEVYFLVKLTPPNMEFNLLNTKA